MPACTICLHETDNSAPVQFQCLRCAVPLVACRECCALRERDYGKGWESLVKAIIECRHVAQEHPSRSEARS